MSELYKSPCYCTNLRRAAKSILKMYDEALKRSGISASQYYLLINLLRMKQANITQWSERVGLDRSTMVRNVKLLQEHNLIELTEGHGKTFVLTEFGAKSVGEAQLLWKDAQKRLENCLGKKDTKAILRISERLQQLEGSEGL